MELPIYKKIDEFEKNYLLDYYNVQNECNYFQYLRTLLQLYKTTYEKSEYITAVFDLNGRVATGKTEGNFKAFKVPMRYYKNDKMYELVIHYSKIINFLEIEIEKEILKLKTPKYSEKPVILEPTEKPEFDFSDNEDKVKVIILEKLGVIDYIKSLQTKPHVTSHTAEILSAVTGIDSGALYSYLLPILQPNRDDANKNSPYKNPENIVKANKNLTNFKIKDDLKTDPDS